MIYGGDSSFNKRTQKLVLQEILKMEPAVQKPLRHSEVPITLSREDQWTSFSEPGKFPLVLDLVVAGSILTRVLIDGGSSLNLIFVSTITRMGLDISNKLKPSKAPFYGIVPGNASTPIGTMVLPDTFGTPDNYRTELIKFEVADFKSSYHAILRRPALANTCCLRCREKQESSLSAGIFRSRLNLKKKPSLTLPQIDYLTPRVKY